MRDFWTYLPIVNAQERNFAAFSINELKGFVRRPARMYILSEAYLGRFDLVSYDVYGTPAYDWAILTVNDILDPWDPALVGQTIKCPDEADIQDFLLEMRKRLEV